MLWEKVRKLSSNTLLRYYDIYIYKLQLNTYIYIYILFSFLFFFFCTKDRTTNHKEIKRTFPLWEEKLENDRNKSNSPVRVPSRLKPLQPVSTN